MRGRVITTASGAAGSAHPAVSQLFRAAHIGSEGTIRRIADAHPEFDTPAIAGSAIDIAVRYRQSDALRVIFDAFHVAAAETIARASEASTDSLYQRCVSSISAEGTVSDCMNTRLIAALADLRVPMPQRRAGALSPMEYAARDGKVVITCALLDAAAKRHPTSTAFNGYVMPTLLEAFFSDDMKEPEMLVARVCCLWGTRASARGAGSLAPSASDIDSVWNMLVNRTTFTDMDQSKTLECALELERTGYFNTNAAHANAMRRIRYCAQPSRVLGKRGREEEQFEVAYSSPLALVI